ncbi:MAG: hypothetical protein U5L04_13870 [Trueperaceae bacterium]|nr:hypothetical protein [Trueperaceae bacterium]
MSEKTNILFVCSANRLRSPTAEDMFAGSEHYNARSAGTHPHAEQRVSQDMIDWADRVFVMSERTDGHKTFLENNFDVGGAEIYDLDIPDVYGRGDPTLVERLREGLEPYLDVSGARA